jgi:hypothetical protein
VPHRSADGNTAGNENGIVETKPSGRKIFISIIEELQVFTYGD